MTSRDKRPVKPTLKGEGLYQSTLDTHLRVHRKSWKEFEDILIEFDDSNRDLRYLRKIEADIEKAKDNYVESYESLISFLSRARYEESIIEMDSQVTQHHKRRNIIENFERQIHDLSMTVAEVLSERLDTRSEASISTRRSASERVKLKYIHRGAELQKQKELLEAKLEFLAKEQKVAELEAEIDDRNDRLSNRKSLPGTDVPIDTIRRQYTADYVSEHCTVNDEIASYRQSARESKDNIDPYKVSLDPSPPSMLNRPAATNLGNLTLNPSAPEFYPLSQTGLVTNFTQFLLKKDLLLSRFSPFNDQAESYQTWKSSFTGIVKELNVSPFEELDLLVKWLGPESKRFASSIRSSNINNPSKGLSVFGSD